MFYARDIRLDMSKPLGKGVFGTVFAAESKQLGLVAVKILADIVALNRTQPADLKAEGSLLTATRHPNLLPVYGMCLGDGDDNTVGIVVKRAASDVTELIRRQNARHASQDERAQYAIHVGIGVARALHHLHNSVTPSLVHCAGHPSNILLSSAAMPKAAREADPLWIPSPADMEDGVLLADFGLDRYMRGLTASLFRLGWNSPEYFPPERISRVSARTDPEPANDIYALGVVLWEMVSGQRPWAECCGDRSVMFDQVLKERRPAMPTGCDEGLAELIRHCWAPRPEDRPVAFEGLGRLMGMVCTALRSSGYDTS